MFRYVAFVWDDADPAARASAGTMAQRLRTQSLEWSSVLHRGGVQVFCAGTRIGSSESYQLREDSGVVVGKLFQRQDGRTSRSAPLALSEGETRLVTASGGRHLIEKYWGRYVAFLHDAPAGVTRVLRDPTGTLPCFTTRFAGVDLYFSRMEDVSQLGSHSSFSVNWKYVAGMLCQTRLQVHSTGLNEVNQVLGGECVEHSEGHSTRQFYWNPLEIARGPVIEDAGEAAAALRETTRECVHAWASSYRSIVHLLSGGLDSSIIFSCLKDAPARPKMAFLNYYSAGCNTDERGYARLVANTAGFELIERQRDSTHSLERLLHIRQSAIPVDYFLCLDGRNEAQLAQDVDATAIFGGYGGDQLFYQARARFAAGDYLASRGADARLFEVALDAARLDKLSIWGVLGDAVRSRLMGTQWRARTDPTLCPPSLVRDEVVRDISRDSDLEHPWLQEQAGGLNGKRWHAYQLLFPLDFYNPLGSDTDPEPVTPLLSQPLMELAMRIPTWLLTRGGWDRAIARRAFQRDLPRQIVIRRTKGGQEEHAKTILARNNAFARELLLDGNLIREGILEKPKVTEALSPGPSRRTAAQAELYGCLSAEAWARKWVTA